MYILISNNTVINGPREWSKRVFERSLSEELNVSLTLPVVKKDNSPIHMSGGVSILPVRYSDVVASHNPRTQIMDGPYWEFTNTEAIGTYVPRDKPIDTVKSEMLAEIAYNRWVGEVAGTTATIQNTVVRLTTQRGERDLYAQALLLGADGRTWKFDNNVWLTLSLQDLQLIVSAVTNHVSSAFVWESSVVAAVISATTNDELAMIDTQWPQNTQ